MATVNSSVPEDVKRTCMPWSSLFWTSWKSTSRRPAYPPSPVSTCSTPLYHAVALRRHGASLVTADERYYRHARRAGRVLLLQDFVAPTG